MSNRSSLLAILSHSGLCLGSGFVLVCLFAVLLAILGGFALLSGVPLLCLVVLCLGTGDIDRGFTKVLVRGDILVPLLAT